MVTSNNRAEETAANLGLDVKLRVAADALGNYMEAT